MKRYFILLMFALFVFASLPIEVYSDNSTSAISYEGLSTQPRKKKYTKRKDHAPKTVHVKGYRKKNGTYVHSYYRRAPKRRH